MKKFNGTFEMVSPHELVVDHKYQRPEKWDLIATIASDPIWEAFGVIVCSKRKGRNGQVFRYVIDGQQRLMGVLAANEIPQEVPVISFEVDSVKEEAELFSRINEARKSVNQYERFRAHITAEDPRYLHIQSAVERAGFTVGSGGSGGSNDPLTVMAIGGLQALYNAGGEEGVYVVLAAIKQAWEGENGWVESWLLRALADVVEEHASLTRDGKAEPLDVDTLAKALARTTPGRLMRKGEENRFAMGGSKRQNIRRALKTLAKI